MDTYAAAHSIHQHCIRVLALGSWYAIHFVMNKTTMFFSFYCLCTAHTRTSTRYLFTDERQEFIASTILRQPVGLVWDVSLMNGILMASQSQKLKKKTKCCLRRPNQPSNQRPTDMHMSECHFRIVANSTFCSNLLYHSYVLWRVLEVHSHTSHLFE